MRNNSIKYLWIMLAAGAVPLLSGCVVRRGSDFGHWAAAGENVPIIRSSVIPKEKKLSGSERVLILPPMGKLPEENRKKLFEAFYQESQFYFPAKVFFAESEGTMEEYLREENLVLTGDILDSSEAGRLGALLGATHVLCVNVVAFRPYPPQVLNLCVSVIDTSDLTVVTEMNASFNASEQTVVAALGDYLRGRRSRRFDSQNLQIMLKSPYEYGAFAASRCTRELSRILWNRWGVKQEIKKGSN